MPSFPQWSKLDSVQSLGIGTGNSLFYRHETVSYVNVSVLTSGAMSPMNCGVAAGWSWAISDGEPLTVSPCCDTNTHGVPAARPAESVIIQSINNRSIPNHKANQSIDHDQIPSVKQVSSSSISYDDTFSLLYPQVGGLSSTFQLALALYFYCTDPDQSWSLATNQCNNHNHCDPIPTQLVLWSPNTIQATFIKLSRSRFSLLLVTNKLEGLMVLLLLLVLSGKWKLDVVYGGTG